MPLDRGRRKQNCGDSLPICRHGSAQPIEPGVVAGSGRAYVKAARSYDDWWNIVEAEQKRQAVAVLSDPRQLDAADVYAFFSANRDLLTITCRPCRELGSSHQRVTLRFTDARTISLRCDEASRDFSAGL